MMVKIKSVAIAIVLALSSAYSLADSVDTQIESDHQRCLNLILNLKNVFDQRALDFCSDFFWDNPDLDSPPGSFNNVILIEYRSLQINPFQADEYSYVAWLLYSKWVIWKQHPIEMPDGQGKVEEALALVKNGRRYFTTNADYHLRVATTFFPIAKYHKPDYFRFVLESYALADQFGTTLRTLKSARFGAAVSCKLMKDWDGAVKWYRAVLKLEPTNAVAAHELQKLCTAGAHC